MAGTLRLTFDSTVSSFDSGSTLTVLIQGASQGYLLNETWVDTRSTNGQVSITGQSPSEDDAENAALNFIQSFVTDYGTFQGRNISVTPPEINVAGDNAIVDIILDDEIWTFSDPVGTTVSDGRVTFEVLDQSVGVVKSVVSSILPSALDPCGKVDVELTMAGSLTTYDVFTSEGNYLGVTSPHTVEFIRRSVRQFISIESQNGAIGSVNVDLPRKITATDIEITPTYGPAGDATVAVVVTYTNSNLSPYEYSINGTDYQTTSSFSSMLAGTYTMYVRDALGCVVTKEFTLDGVSQETEIVFSISEINPIRFIKKREVGEKKNFTNSLSCEALKDLPYKGIHSFPVGSTNTIQIQTNAPYIKVYALDLDGAETLIPHFQSVKNTGLTGYTTATLFSVGGKATLYWGYTDELDPLTDEVIGNINFGSFVPTWADDTDKILEVEGIGAVGISNIYYDPDKQASVVELNSSYTGAESEVNAKGTYNEQTYDVYEFSVAMASLPSAFNLFVDYGADAGNLETGWHSETIKLIEDSDEYLRLDYWDDENRGNFIYQTDIQHHIYLKGILDYVGEQNTEGYNGDTDFYKTNDEIYFTFNMICEFLPSPFVHKLRLMTAHKFFYVNGLRCKLAEAPEPEGEIATNLKNFTVLLKAGGNDFASMESQNILSSEDSLSGALEAIQGKANILWTKSNG